ncbi:serum amyloid P-component-like [Engraulis encrasicolus]|uniref:serum amyloid P-component-like n=1 Tax=Engraulis encrasicolus TaxID=184585 RepID=UPI002FD24C0C
MVKEREAIAIVKEELYAQLNMIFHLTFMIFCTASQAASDLSGKVVIFPVKGNTAHVRLTPLLSNILFSTTFCLRFYTDLSTGLARVTVNEVHSVKTSRHAGGSIAGTPIIILCQDQDSYGGGFDANQAFTGHIKDVHMWDHVISACEINNYMQGFAHSPGNYLDWTRMDYSVHGYVLVEDDDTC